MTQLQSGIGIATLLACLVVGLWASQRSPSPEMLAEIAPPSRNGNLAPAPTAAKSDDALIEETLRQDAAAADTIAPRKLTVESESSAAQHPVARLLAREMPDASEEERQIWFEEMKHLPLSAVEDLLKVRRHSSPLSELPGPIVGSLKKSPTVPQTRTDSIWAEGTRTTLLRCRAVLRQNLLNIDTVGYRCVEPQLSAFPLKNDVADTTPLDGLRWIGSRLSLQQGVLEVTERQLDLAISGAGWFVVVDDHEKLAFTRNGAFQLNEQRQLELQTPAGPRRVHPVIQLAESPDALSVNSQGAIFSVKQDQNRGEYEPLGQIQLARFFDDSALTLSTDGLYVPLPRAGTMRLRTPGDQCGTLRTGMLERANVNQESQRQALERLERWLAGSPRDRAGRIEHQPQPATEAPGLFDTIRETE